MLWNTVELTRVGPQLGSLRSARSFWVTSGTAITCTATPGSCSSLCSLVAMFFGIVFALLLVLLAFGIPSLS